MSQGHRREAAAMIQSRDDSGFDQGGGEIHSDKCHTLIYSEPMFFA